MIVKLHYSSNSEVPNTFNFGIAFLKVFLAFDVIRSHNFNIESTKNKLLRYCLRNRRIHVPTFFIISFFFMHKEFISLNINKYIKRLERLIIPYLIWPIIIWILNNIFNFLFNTNFPSSLANLKNQIFWGNDYIMQLWFQWDLIIITILFFILIFLFKTNYLIIIQLLAILAYILQYSGINKIFYESLSNEKRECLGRLAEVLPYTVTGSILASLQIIKKLKKCKLKTIIFSVLIYILIEKFSIFSNINGIAYAGIKLNISSICIFFSFSLFPSEKIKKNCIKVFLKNITNFTAGIFYLHWSIIIYLRDYIKIIEKGCFSGLIMIYLFSYFISFFGIRIFGKTQLKHLFL